MSQRNSGYSRVANELYETPEWVVCALAEHLKISNATVWEPAAGRGAVVAALKRHGCEVIATDLVDHGCENVIAPVDFSQPLADLGWKAYDGIITNPPYGFRGTLAEKFIRRGIERIPAGGFMAMLLSADFDSGKTRTDMFRHCPMFIGKVVLLRRIKWFEGDNDPSANHAWYIWQNNRVDPLRTQPKIFYAP